MLFTHARFASETPTPGNRRRAKVIQCCTFENKTIEGELTVQTNNFASTDVSVQARAKEAEIKSKLWYTIPKNTCITQKL